MRTLTALALTLSLLACQVPAVDLSGKSCPCAPNYGCVEGFCVEGAEDGDHDADADSDLCEPEIIASDFRGLWRTPNGICWTWQPTCDRALLLRYEVHVAESLEDLNDRSGSFRLFDPAVNVELGDCVLQRGGSPDDEVTTTVTDGLEHATDYVARLVAIDTNLCEFRSLVAAYGTSDIDSPSEIVLFRDDNAGYFQPPTFTRTPDEEGPGFHLEYHPEDDMNCPLSETICPENLRYQGLEIPLAPISAGAFDTTALLEFSIASNGSPPSYWSSVWLVIAGTIYRYDGWTLRSSDDYVLVQFPLNGFQSDGSLLTHEDITASNVNGFVVYGQWVRDTPVRIDEVRIRY